MMPQPEIERYQPDFSTRLGGFLKRLLWAFLKLFLVFIFLVAILASAWLIYREIDRSFDVVNNRMDFNAGQIEEAEQDILALQEANGAAEDEIKILQTAAADRDAAIATLESELATTLDQQGADLVQLEEEVAALIASTNTISGNLAFLNDGLVSLQGDTTANVSDIDALGGEIDALGVSLDTLDDEIAAVQLELGAYSADEFNRMRQTIELFRLWELVSRARLHLVGQNAGLAAADVTSAQLAADLMINAIPLEEDAHRANLEQIRDRLLLAGTNLPDDPVVAARDLETAFELLDAALAALSAEPAPTPTATPIPEGTS